MKNFIVSYCLLITSIIAIFNVTAQTRTQSNIKKLISTFAESKFGEEQFAVIDAQAKRQSQAAIELLMMGYGEEVWSPLKQSPDPSLHSYLIRDINKCGIFSDIVINQLKSEKDNSIIRALVLTLGGYTNKQLSVEKERCWLPIF